MKVKAIMIIEWFLRISLSAGFLSAVADRFGLWNKELSAWGNWNSFIAYTSQLLPFLPSSLTSIAGMISTGLEFIFGIALLTNFKTSFFAKCSGLLLLLFALAMTFSKSIKVPLDSSVFTSSAAAFALSALLTGQPNTEKKSSR